MTSAKVTTNFSSLRGENKESVSVETFERQFVSGSESPMSMSEFSSLGFLQIL